MSVFKRGKAWWCEFQYKGRRYRQATGQLNENDARAFEATARLRVRRQVHGLDTEPIPTPTFQDWAEVFYATIEKRVKRPDAKAFLIQSALRFWGERPTDPAKLHKAGVYHDLSLGDVVAQPSWILRWETWLEQRGWSNQTKNHYRSLLHQMFQLAMSPLYRQQTGITTNPFAGQWRDPVRGRESVLSRQDLTAILGAASWHLRLAIAVALLGPKLRLGNILKLEWNVHVAPDFSRIRVDDHKTSLKTGRPLVVYVPEQLRAILEEARRRDPKAKFVVNYQGRPISEIRGAVAGAVTRAKVVAPHLKYGRAVDQGITFHTLRHTAATFLAEIDVSPEKRRQLMGHESLASTMRYTHLQATHEAETAEQLSAALPLTGLVLTSGRRPRKTA